MSLYKLITFLKASTNTKSPLTLLRSSNLITNLIILIDLVLVKKTTIMLFLLGLIFLILNHKYRVLLVHLYSISFFLILL